VIFFRWLFKVVSAVIAYIAAHNLLRRRTFARCVALFRSSVRLSPGQRLGRDNPTQTVFDAREHLTRNDRIGLEGFRW